MTSSAARSWRTSWPRLALSELASTLTPVTRAMPTIRAAAVIAVRRGVGGGVGGPRLSGGGPAEAPARSGPAGGGGWGGGRGGAARGARHRTQRTRDG